MALNKLVTQKKLKMSKNFVAVSVVSSGQHQESTFKPDSFRERRNVYISTNKLYDQLILLC